MSYCTLEEAWGPDFKKKHKKSKKERKLERQEQKMLDESIDPQILIPETHQLSDYRKELTSDNLPNPDKSNIGGYDSSFDSYVSPYQRFTTDIVERSNEAVLSDNKRITDSVVSKTLSVEQPVEDMIQLTRSEYESLKHEVVEGFANQTDTQLNQLLLYIFTGIFYLLMLDMMYQLGKKSY